MTKSKEQDVVYETLARFDERINRFTAQDELDRDEGRPYGHSYRFLYEIEQFVKTIQDGWRGGSIIGKTPKGRRKKRWQTADRAYKKMSKWLKGYSPMYRYAAKVEVFYEVCDEFDLTATTIRAFKDPLALNHKGISNIELFHLLIEEIARRCDSREFKERERLRINNARRNESKALALEERMFDAKSRYSVLSLTLKILPNYRDKIDLAEMQRLRFRFLKSRRFNTLMAGVENYIWALEQGSDTGLHLHFILFYDGRHNHDEFIAEQIREYWIESVTRGAGSCWNSNRAWCKRRYKQIGHGVGVGQINWYDVEMRRALRKNLKYLAKAQQYLMIKAPKVRTFGMGAVPKKQQQGRPRKVVEAILAGE